MAVKFEAKDFKKITLNDMADFIEKYYPEEKQWFKEAAYMTFINKDGEEYKQYNHLKAVRKFCEKFNPDLLPKPSEKKEPASNRLKDW